MSRHFEFNPSHYLAALLLLVHGACLVVLPLLALPRWSVAALMAIVAGSLAYHLWRDAWLRAPDSCIALLLERNDAVLTLRDGNQLRGRVEQGLVTPMLTVLNVLPDGARATRSLVILPDSLSAEAFRQLRVLLRWGRQAGR